jgi:glycerol-1-phosphate dehydrogenase [NAD(P)+]
MDYQRINAALEQASDTRCVTFGAGVLAAVDETFAQCFGEQPAVVVADENTWRVAGEKVQARLTAAGRRVEPPVVFAGRPVLYADYGNVLELEGKLHNLDAVPVVVGSGTMNDITKLAAHRSGRQYMVVATAASMDGYTSYGAAITRDGFKQTMSCPAPRAVLADIETLVEAPPEMTSAGYGDLLGKVTAGADWIIADALESEPIDPRAWALVQNSLRDWTGKPGLLHAGDRQAVEDLFEGLIMTGVAMQISASSRPASGSEHRFSHLWEMQALGHGHAAVPHGFKVGVGTLAAAALYERVLLRDLSNINIEAICSRWPSRIEVERSVRDAHDIPQLAENAVEESMAKYLDPDQLRRRLVLLGERWPSIRERVQAQLLPAVELRDMLRAAGAPTEPEEVAVSMAQLRASYGLARTIRARYTVLDLVHEAEVLDECVEELFAPGGFWSRGRRVVHVEGDGAV